MDFLSNFISDFIGILNEMSPYLLLGFLFAGILKVFLPQQFIDNHLSKPNLKSVFYASLLGIPMPLCSCGVIPTGVSIYKNGANKGATVSFLISTPQTGIDSILATYSLLGLPFAIIRPIVALFTGVAGGLFTNKLDNGENFNDDVTMDSCDADCCSENANSTTHQHSKLYRILQYAFVDFLKDIYKWLLIGMFLAAIISVLVPDNFFEQFIGNPWLEMFVILLVAIPIYVCATGSIPIVAVLMLKGLSPGAALVFLMAGPATNIATITVLNKTLGNRTMWIYLLSITIGAILFGGLMNTFAPPEWFDINLHTHTHLGLPYWMKWGSTIVLTMFIMNVYIQRYKKKTQKEITNNMKVIVVNGMNCNHCKNSVEQNIANMPSIHSVEADITQKTVFIEGDNIDLNKIKETIESLGFEYGGEINNQ